MNINILNLLENKCILCGSQIDDYICTGCAIQINQELIDRLRIEKKYKWHKSLDI